MRRTLLVLSSNFFMPKASMRDVKPQPKLDTIRASVTTCVLHEGMCVCIQYVCHVTSRSSFHVRMRMAHHTIPHHLPLRVVGVWSVGLCFLDGHDTAMVEVPRLGDHGPAHRIDLGLLQHERLRRFQKLKVHAHTMIMTERQRDRERGIERERQTDPTDSRAESRESGGDRHTGKMRSDRHRATRHA